MTPLEKLAARLRNLSAANAPLPGKKDFIFAERALVRKNIPLLPPAYVDFLKNCNSFRGEGCALFGILPGTQNSLDIVNINFAAFLPPEKEVVILGENEFDFLVFCKTSGTYLIIDKEDLEVLEEYTELEKAICNILKL